MIEVEMKVGPKGQVVIPSVFRKNFNIHSGNKVIFQSEGNRLILRKTDEDTVETLKKIAEETEEADIDSDRDYDERMEERLG